MTQYVLCKNVIAQQTSPSAGAIPTGSQIANLSAGGALGSVQPPTNQTFHVVETGSGNVTATVQIFVSNDGQNFIAYGSAISIASAAAPQQASSTGTAAWAYYTAQVTAISGTSASVTVTMNA